MTKTAAPIHSMFPNSPQMIANSMCTFMHFIMHHVFWFFMFHDVDMLFTGISNHVNVPETNIEVDY